MSVSVFTLFVMAGFIREHVVQEWRSGDRDIAPVAFVVTHGQQKLTDFPGKTLEDMVTNARQSIAKGDFEATALAYEGFFLVNGVRKPALFIEISKGAGDESHTIVQFVDDRAGGQKLPLGDPFVFRGDIKPGVVTGNTDVPIGMSEKEARAFNDGVLRRRRLAR